MKVHKNFPEDKGTFCLISNLRSYLSYYGPELTEIWLGAALGLFGFYYTNKPLPCREIVHGRNGHFSDIAHRFEEILEDKPDKINISADKDALTCIEELTSQGDIPLVRINDFFLPHTDYYNIAAYWSLVPVLDIRGQNVLYYDNGIRTMEAAAFLEATDDEGTRQIACPSSKGLALSGSRQYILARGIRESADSMRRSADTPGEYWGIEGMRVFAEDLGSHRDTKLIYHIYYLLNNPGGLTVTRRNIAVLCEQLKAQYTGLKLDSHIEFFHKLSEDWRMSANLLFKLSRTSDIELQSRIVGRINDIIEAEAQGVELLYELAAQIELMDND